MIEGAADFVSEEEMMGAINAGMEVLILLFSPPLFDFFPHLPFLLFSRRAGSADLTTCPTLINMHVGRQNKCKQKAVRAICTGLAIFAAKVQEVRGDQSLSQLIRKPADSLFDQMQAEVSDALCACVRSCVSACECVCAHTGACKHTRGHICIMPYLPLFITHFCTHTSTPNL